MLISSNTQNTMLSKPSEAFSALSSFLSVYINQINIHLISPISINSPSGRKSTGDTDYSKYVGTAEHAST